jgi:Holliday junction resolvase-like predicted endonuclease
VNRTKQARIRRLGARWLAENRGRLDRRSWSLRFDVASVLHSKVDVLEAAF